MRQQVLKQLDSPSQQGKRRARSTLRTPVVVHLSRGLEQSPPLQVPTSRDLHPKVRSRRVDKILECVHKPYKTPRNNRKRINIWPRSGTQVNRQQHGHKNAAVIPQAIAQLVEYQ